MTVRKTPCLHDNLRKQEQRQAAAVDAFTGTFWCRVGHHRVGEELRTTYAGKACCLRCAERAKAKRHALKGVI